jgi:hypothetical protein
MTADLFMLSDLVLTGKISCLPEQGGRLDSRPFFAVFYLTTLSRCWKRLTG